MNSVWEQVKKDYESNFAKVNFFIGRSVLYFSHPNSTPIETKISESPWQLGHGQWVCKIHGISGCVSLTSLEFMDTPKFFTYKKIYKNNEHFKTIDIITVKYDIESQTVTNKQGVKMPVRHFLSRPHCYHESENPPEF